MPVPAGKESELAASREKIGWLLVFFLALGLRLGHVAWSPPALDGDQRAYLLLAESVSAGEGYRVAGIPQTHIAPLFPVLHALASKLIGDSLIGGRATAILIASLLPVTATWAVTGLLGFKLGLPAGVLIALHPHLIVRSSFLEPEALAAALSFTLAGLLQRRRVALAGITLGLAYLSRPEFILLLPAVALILAVRNIGWRRIAIFAVPCLAVSSPFLLYLKQETGHWRVSGKDRWVYTLGVHQWRSRNQPLEPAQLTELQREVGSPVSHLLSNPIEFATGYAYRGALLTRNLARAIMLPLIPFLVVGAAWMWKTARNDSLFLLLPLFLLPVLPIGLTLYRHVMTVTPLLVGITGIGFLPAAEAIRSRLRPGR